MGLPVFLQSCLWSYDISVMDKDESKKWVNSQNALVKSGNYKLAMEKIKNPQNRIGYPFSRHSPMA